jgi:hypothetical protein
VTATAQAVLNVARGQLGFLEGPRNDNHNPYGPYFGWPDRQAYCDEFVSWCAAHAAAADIIGKSYNCDAHIRWFKARGQFGHTPRVGSVAFFDWNSDGSAEHTGFVDGILPDGRVRTIEGNTRDPQSTAPGSRQGVFQVHRSAALVLGYGHPAYGAPRGAPIPLPRPSRSGGRLVIPLVVDGAWGPKTTRRVQELLHVPVDGVRGPLTIRAIQRWVGCRQDGQMGPDTIRHLQAKVGARTDGRLGPDTIRRLQRALNRAI